MSKGKLAEKQAELEQSQGVTQATQAELEAANTQITSLKTQLSTERSSLADTKSKLESTRSEMYTAKQEVTRTQQQLKEAKDTVAELEDAATELRADLVKTEKSLAEASKEAELAQLNERIEELAKANDTLKQDLMAAEAINRSRASRNTDAKPTTHGFSPSTTAAVQPASIGSETTVASISANDGIVILNSTPELGLSVGSEITLIQGWKALGKVQITKVTEQLAVANILPGTKLRGIAKGDTVKIMH